jgi:hypothetical protein
MWNDLCANIVRVGWVASRESCHWANVPAIYPGDIPRNIMENTMTEMRILIADDNATLRGIIRSAVENIGMFEIDVVGNGVDALRLYREKHHEVMIMSCRGKVASKS